MILKQTSLNSLFIGLMIFLILPLSIQAQNYELEQNIKKRGNESQATYTAILLDTPKKGQYFLTGLSSAGGMASKAISRYRNRIIIIPTKDLKQFLVLKRAGKLFKYFDIATTGYKVIYESKDLKDVGKHVLNHVASGIWSKAAIYGFTAIAGTAVATPVTIACVGVGSACLYTLGVEYLGDKINDYSQDIEFERYSHTKEYKEKVKKYYLDMCLQIKKEYIKTGIRPSKVYFDPCIKYGIDIYRVCPKNAEARWSSEKNKIQCHCIKGFRENQARNKCIPEKDCSKWRGSVAVRDKNTHKTVCRCPKGYKWIKVMNQCANHYQVEVYCDKKWSGSIPAWDKKNKKQSCRCPDGTEWNKNLNKCAKITSYQDECKPESRSAVRHCKTKFVQVWRDKSSGRSGLCRYPDLVRKYKLKCVKRCSCLSTMRPTTYQKLRVR